MNKVKEVFKRDSGEHQTSSESTPSRAYDAVEHRGSTGSEAGNPLHGSRSGISSTGGTRTSGVDTSTDTGKREAAAERALGAGNTQRAPETTAAGLNTYGTTDTNNAGVTSGGNVESGTGITPTSGTGAGTRSGAAASARTRGLSGARSGEYDTEGTHTSPVVGAGNLKGDGRAIGDHQFGHGLSHTSVDDNAEYDSQHLKHVTHNEVRHLEAEEVERQREHDVHVHHVQHHVQPVKDQEVRDEVHHNQVHPVTNVHEVHSSTQNDKDRYKSLGAGFKDEERHLPKERTVIDRGERVNENTHHHVHQVIQPVIEREVHDRHRIHTVIPTKHVTHEAPIIHKSTKHEPVHLDQFLSQGGKLDSNATHDRAGVLHEGDCSRKVDGVGEDLARSLHLSNAGTYDRSYGTGAGARSTGTAGEPVGEKTL